MSIFLDLVEDNNLNIQSFIDQIENKNNTPEQILKLIIETRISKNGYQILRNFSIFNKNNLFCPYYEILACKKQCYPDFIILEPNAFFLDAGEMVILTLKRLFKTLIIDQTFLKNFQTNILSVEIKCGMDGAHSNSEYRNFFRESKIGDAFFVFASFTILNVKLNDNQIYENNSPNSTKISRPLVLVFEKESDELCLEIKNKIEEDLNKYLEFAMDINGEFFDFSISIRSLFTAIDGKMFNAFINNRATTRCPICLLTYKDFKDIKYDNFNHNTQSIKNKFQYGFSQLHFKINCFNFLLKIAHTSNLKNIEIIKGCKLNKIDKELAIKEFREYYQIEFAKKLNLKIDYVDPGYGRTNTGNNVKECLKNYKYTSEILKIDINIVKNLNEITTYLYSLKEINLNDYISLLNETHDLIRSTYSDISIPPSVHKILVHSPAIIKELGLSPGKYCEENSECLIKVIRLAISRFSRKESPISNLTDIVHYLLINSDPFINNLKISN